MDFEINKWTNFERERVCMRNYLRSAPVNGAVKNYSDKAKGRHIGPPLLPFRSHVLSLSQASRYLDAISGLQQRILGFAFLDRAKVVLLRRQKPAGVSARNFDTGRAAACNPTR